MIGAVRVFSCRTQPRQKVTPISSKGYLSRRGLVGINLALVLVILLAALSVFMAGINIFGGFLVTRRMLAMFQKS